VAAVAVDLAIKITSLLFPGNLMPIRLALEDLEVQQMHYLVDLYLVQLQTVVVEPIVGLYLAAL
jgi:hypothetical protein